LAYRGWKAANVPVVLGAAPPEILCALDPHVVVGLTIDPERLAVIRRARLKRLGLAESSSYTDPAHIREELHHCLTFCRARRWPVINVTGKAVEETANDVISLVTPHPSKMEWKL
jgi:regulator of PEP synthase PpsR (kinase-PPPase family)